MLKKEFNLLVQTNFALVNKGKKKHSRMHLQAFAITYYQNLSSNNNQLITIIFLSTFFFKHCIKFCSKQKTTSSILIQILKNTTCLP